MGCSYLDEECIVCKLTSRCICRKSGWGRSHTAHDAPGCGESRMLLMTGLSGRSLPGREPPFSADK